MRRRYQRGVALAIVLWFLAGMSLLVAGIVFQARTDSRMAQLHLARAIVTAAGDGAMQLMMADLTRLSTPPAGPLEGTFELGPRQVTVRLVPAILLLDPARADAPALAALFVRRGGLGDGEAQALARSVVEWRQPAAGRGTDAGVFESPEDLMRVRGFTRSTWDGIRDYIAVDAGSAGDGPGELDEAAAALAPTGETRGQAPGPVPAEDTPGGLGNRFRVDALVTYGGHDWLRRKWVELTPSEVTGLPWRYTRVEAPRVIPRARPGDTE